MTNEIQVFIRNVYGNETVYPKCELAVKLAKLAGHTTLTYRDIALIKEMGITVRVVSEHNTTL
jgi:hypothetical protein